MSERIKRPPSGFITETERVVPPPLPRGGNHPPDLPRRYATTGVLGRGGMGTVVAAHDELLQREVAVKVLDPQLAATTEVRQVFIGEARLTAQLDHPNIVPVHDLGSDSDSDLYFTMKRIGGKTLHALLNDPDFLPGSSERLSMALSVYLKVCDAVAFAHSRGVLHRDIKPENIMVGSFGEVYLVDWGVACVLPEREGSVKAGLAPWGPLSTPRDWMVGTPAYMAPEMARSQTHLVDERTDIFGLGATLYEIVTGEPPYEGPSEMALEKARGLRFLPPGAFANAFVPQKLARVVAKAMAEKREDRYQTATELAAEVREFIERGLHLPRKSFRKGAMIVEEGDLGDCAYILLRGSCDVFKLIKGEKRVLRRMGPGAMFGESALFADLRRSASVEAVSDVTLLVLTRAALEESFASDSWEGVLVKTLIERFREADAKLANFDL